MPLPASRSVISWLFISLFSNCLKSLHPVGIERELRDELIVVDIAVDHLLVNIVEQRVVDSGCTELSLQQVLVLSLGSLAEALHKQVDKVNHSVGLFAQVILGECAFLAALVDEIEDGIVLEAGYLALIDVLGGVVGKSLDRKSVV